MAGRLDRPVKVKEEIRSWIASYDGVSLTWRTRRSGGSVAQRRCGVREAFLLAGIRAERGESRGEDDRGKRPLRERREPVE